MCLSFVDGEVMRIKTLRQICEREKLNKLVTFGIHGAAVMIGSCGGVAILSEEKISWLISNYWIAHRLELAAAQAAYQEAYVKMEIFTCPVVSLL